MGKAKLRLRRFTIDDFSKGYFPNKDFDDVPDGGSYDCKHVYYDQSALRKFPGMDRINSSQAATTRGNGIHYLDVNGATKRSAVFSAKFYEDVSGTWTDRTGAVTITDGANNLVQAINHQQGANKYAIYVNGVNPPWKWTGTGNAAVLGGSPPANFTSISKYHETIFGSYAESVYFSDTGDPETWNASKWVIPFDFDVTRLIDNGQKLAVFMKGQTGSIAGYDYLDFSKEETEISNVGCVGRLAACNAFFGKSDTPVIATVSRDGLYLIDQSFGVEKIFGDEYFQSFNQENIHKATVAYCDIDNLLYVALPYDTATENDYVVMVDMVSGAFWPAPSIHANSVRALASMRTDTNLNEHIYFIDTNGYAFKFNSATKNYHTGTGTQGIDARWKSKRFDLGDVYSLRVPMMIASADGAWAVRMACGFGLTTDDGTSNDVNLTDNQAVLGSFVLGASTLGGSSYIFNVLGSVGSFGRFITVTLSNSDVDESFNIKKIEMLIRRRRMGTNDK